MTDAEECKNACKEEQNCNAVIIITGKGCTLVGCPLPVPAPTLDNGPSYKGYYKTESKYHDKFARCLHEISLKTLKNYITPYF